MQPLEYLERRATLLAPTDDPIGLDAILKLRDLEGQRWEHKHWELKRAGDPTASFLTGTNVELIYINTASGTAKNTFTTEVQINDTAGMGAQANLPPYFFMPVRGVGSGLRIVARGIVSSTGTPTYTFTTRLGTAGTITAARALASAAITTGSGITNKGWEFEGDVGLRTTAGAPGANSTLQGAGMISGPAAFASPFQFELWGGGAQPGTDATLDISINNFVNFNVACSASNASNTITLLQLLIFGLN